MRAAHLKLIEAGRVDSSLAGMGTTIVAAQVSEGQLIVASVGDSRLYLFDGRTLRQVTRDDSWIEAVLEENPDADRAALHVHPLRHALTNVLSTSSDAEIHIVEIPLAGGEVIALTTDGVHGTLDEQRHRASAVDAGRAGRGRGRARCRGDLQRQHRQLHGRGGDLPREKISRTVSPSVRICGIIPDSFAFLLASSRRFLEVLLSSCCTAQDGRAIFVRFCWS